MPPLIALLLTLVFCVYTLRRFTRDPEADSALWLPVIWIFFIASRHPAQWIELFGLGNLLPGSYEEGSPIDAFFFLFLIVAGIRTLARRGVRFSELLHDNFWLFAFVGYCALSIVWSDFPFVAFKRWIKTLGHPVMALVILSDPRPAAALRLVFTRCGLIMLPLSILFIKYFPQYGRSYNPWTGAQMNNGINLNKNELGYCCLVFGLFFAWNLIISRKIAALKARKDERMLSVALLLMILWLLFMAKSSTSLVTLAVGTAVMFGLGFNFFPKRYFGGAVLAVVTFIAVAELTIGLYQPFLALLGKDATLTDRTTLWSDVIGLVDSPLFGTGFESFWLGERLDFLWAKWFWKPNQAHNGYLETYLTLGLIGVGVLFALLLSTFRKITRSFSYELNVARLRMGFLLAIILYNFTEASFKATHLLWTIFYLIAWNLPKSRLPSVTPSSAAFTDEERLKEAAPVSN